MTFLEEKGRWRFTLSLPETCKLYGRSGLMETVIRNLLVNALRYSPAGEEIRVELKKEQGKRLVLPSENTECISRQRDFGRILMPLSCGFFQKPEKQRQRPGTFILSRKFYWNNMVPGMR